MKPQPDHACFSVKQVYKVDIFNTNDFDIFLPKVLDRCGQKVNIKNVEIAVRIHMKQNM